MQKQNFCVELPTDSIMHLQSLNSDCKLNEGIRVIVLDLGLDYYKISIFSYIGKLGSEIFSLSNFPREWQTHYQRHDYAEANPILRHTRSNNTPVVWWDQPFTPFTLPSRDSKMAAAAKAHGLVMGVSAPVHDISANCWSLLTLATYRDDVAAVSRVRNALLVIPFLACCLHEVVLGLSSKPASAALTKRESECLHWCSEGKTSWEISKILGISERTAVFHLQNATRKLGVSNRTQAVVQAIPILRSEARQRLLIDQQMR